MEQKFYTVDDIMKILCIGKFLVYNTIKNLNAECCTGVEEPKEPEKTCREIFDAY